MARMGRPPVTNPQLRTYSTSIRMHKGLHDKFVSLSKATNINVNRLYNMALKEFVEKYPEATVKEQ